MDAVLFDWDGTLVDSLDTFYRANAEVMAAFGLPFDRAAYRRHYAADWRVLYRRLGVPDERMPEAQAVWQRHFRVDGTRVFDGNVEALSALASAGYRLGLVTATSRALVEPLLARFDLGGLLAVRVFGDDMDVHKPDPGPLRLALDRLGLADRPDRVVYVGDAPDDMRMARAVGVRAIGIESILADGDALRAAGADDVHPTVRAWAETFLERPILRDRAGAADPTRRPAG